MRKSRQTSDDRRETLLIPYDFKGYHHSESKPQKFIENFCGLVL